MLVVQRRIVLGSNFTVYGKTFQSTTLQIFFFLDQSDI